MINILLLSLLVCMSNQLAFAQDASLKIVQVNEQRHTGDVENRMSIIVAVESLKIDADHLIQIKGSPLIIDNTGTVLAPFKNYPYGGYFQSDKEISIGYKAPRRNDNGNKKIRGTMETLTIAHTK